MVLYHLGRLVLFLVHLELLEGQCLVSLDLLDRLDMEDLVLLEVHLVHLVRMNQVSCIVQLLRYPYHQESLSWLRHWPYLPRIQLRLV